MVPTPTSTALTGLVIALVLAIEAPAGAQETRREPPPDFALVGGTVMDGTGSPSRPKCTVVVRGGRIHALLRRRFRPVDHVAVVRGSRELERPVFQRAAAEENFLLRGFDHLLVFEKERRRAAGDGR